MAASWGFAMLLVLALVALITFSQPLFQSDQAVVGHTQSNLEVASDGAVARGAPLQNLLITKTLQGGCSRQQRARKLINRNLSPPGANKEMESETNSHTPRRSVLATFQSDRMVPTGPNPLHNSNRSQIIFP